ncbi:MAG: DMT family transporter [Bryobacteraceae bacterium]
MNRRRADLALIGNTVIWGATFTLVKTAIGSVSPILFLALRFSLATAALAVFFRFRGAGDSPANGRVKLAGTLGRRVACPTTRPASKEWTRRRGGERGEAGECTAPAGMPPVAPSSGPLGAPGRRRGTRFWPGALTGAFLFCGYLLQTQGLRFTTAPKSAFLTGLASVMVPLLGALVYKSRPQVSEVVGVLVATAGLGLMTLQGAVGSIGRGDLLTLLGALGFAAHVVALGHFSEHMSFEFLSVMQVGSAAVLSLALCWWMERPHAEWRPVVVCAILITGFLATALAFTVQAWAQQFTTSTRTALIYMLEPVFAWITSYVWAGENLTGRAAVGAVLILGGVMLVEMKPLYPRLHPSQ